jgi:Homeodomain-like domain
MVWRLQHRLAESGVDGLPRDKPRRAPITAETTARLVALTCTEPPHQATHWTGRAMAKAIGISLGSAQRIWRAHKLQPHRLRTFKRSRDPRFAAKLSDIVGLYVDPPAHPVLLSLDEKSQMQALDRTQPGLPIKPGRCQTLAHDYKRHGTTTLFAALSVLDGTVFGRCMQRHRHLEFIRFLNTVEREVPAGKVIHMCSTTTPPTHKHPKVLAWLSRHPRWIFYFTPTSRLVAQCRREFLFQDDAAAPPPRRLPLDRRPAGCHQCLSRRTQRLPQPFVWTQSADAILAKLDRALYYPSDSVHCLFEFARVAGRAAVASFTAAG